MFGIKFWKSNPAEYIIHYSRGKIVREGPGLSFFYFAPSSVILQVPLSSVNVPFVFNEATADFQTLTIQGQLTYRISDPRKASSMLDYTVNPNGKYRSDENKKLPDRLIYSLQTFVRAEIQTLPLKQALVHGETLTTRLGAGIGGDPIVAQLGVEILNVTVLSLRPTPDIAKALEAETRESLQQSADQAVYLRRNASIDEERRIKENELQTELLIQEKQRNLRERQMAGAIDLERQRAALTDQKSENERKEADSRAYALQATMTPIKDIDWRVLTLLSPNGGDARTTIAMAFQELAANAQKIGELNISPDLLQSLIGATASSKKN